MQASILHVFRTSFAAQEAFLSFPRADMLGKRKRHYDTADLPPDRRLRANVNTLLSTNALTYTQAQSLFDDAHAGGCRGVTDLTSDRGAGEKPPARRARRAPERGQTSGAMYLGGCGGDWFEGVCGPGRTSRRSAVGTRGTAASRRSGSLSACRTNILPSWRATARWRNWRSPAAWIVWGKSTCNAASRKCKWIR